MMTNFKNMKACFGAVAAILCFAAGCSKDYIEYPIGTLQDLAVSPQTFALRVPHAEDRWWIRLIPEGELNTPAGQLVLKVTNRGNHVLTVCYSEQILTNLPPKSAAIMFEGTFQEYLIHSKSKTGLWCQSEESRQVEALLEFNFQHGSKMNVPVQIVAYSQAILP